MGISIASVNGSEQSRCEIMQSEKLLKCTPAQIYKCLNFKKN